MSADVVCDVDEDDLFDHELPLRLRGKSSVHFTPLAVARRAARMLAPRPGMRVLDVGAGVGKFCVAAAREVPTCRFVGVELRPHLVRLARALASKLAIDNATFIVGDALDLDWSEYDAFYFYNPFAEQLQAPHHRLDGTLDFEPSKFDEYVNGVCGYLAAARIGTRVVTYHSLGAPAPLGYDLVESHPIATDCVDLWVKARHFTRAELEDVRA